MKYFILLIALFLVYLFTNNSIKDNDYIGKYLYEELKYKEELTLMAGGKFKLLILLGEERTEYDGDWNRQDDDYVSLASYYSIPRDAKKFTADIQLRRNILTKKIYINYSLHGNYIKQ